VLRQFAQPVIDRELRNRRDVAPALEGVDLTPILSFARRQMAKSPLTPAALRSRFRERFPDLDAGALTAACRNRLPLVQVPPRGVWGRPGGVAYTDARDYLSRSLPRRAPADEVVVRYFGAFGPATVADVAAWSGLTGMRELVERIRPRLQAFRDDRGRELFDLVDAPRPDGDTPAPVRFLPEYDNVLLSHADRSRFITDDERRRLSAGDRKVSGSVMVDGRVFGTWRSELDEAAGRITLFVDHMDRAPRATVVAVSCEGEQMLAFRAPEVTSRDIRFVRLG
jgi:DNA glycosylase AlkZ-like